MVSVLKTRILTLQDYCEDFNIPQTTVAKKLGITQQAISLMLQRESVITLMIDKEDRIIGWSETKCPGRSPR